MNKTNPSVVIDDTDKKILTILRTDGRISMSELGKRVHLSGQAIKNRMDRLTNIGVVHHYTVNVNCPVYGHKVHALIRLSLKDARTDRLLPCVSKYHIGHCYRTTGSPDYMLDGYFKDEDELKELLQQLDRLATYEGAIVLEDFSLDLECYRTEKE